MSFRDALNELSVALSWMEAVTPNTSLLELAGITDVNSFISKSGQYLKSNIGAVQLVAREISLCCDPAGVDPVEYKYTRRFRHRDQGCKGQLSNTPRPVCPFYEFPFLEVSEHYPVVVSLEIGCCPFQSAPAEARGGYLTSLPTNFLIDSGIDVRALGGDYLPEAMELAEQWYEACRREIKGGAESWLDVGDLPQDVVQDIASSMTLHLLNGGTKTRCRPGDVEPRGSGPEIVHVTNPDEIELGEWALYLIDGSKDCAALRTIKANARQVQPPSG